MLLETMGVYDLSPRGAVRLVGDATSSLAATLSIGQPELAIGQARECQIATGSRTVSLLGVRLTGDEIVFLTGPGDAEFVTEFLRPEPGSCVHLVDISSGLACVGIAGPKEPSLLSMITELDVSAGALFNLYCVQSRFAEVQGLLVRQDLGAAPAYQLYCAREFGEYIWEAITEAARHIGGGPVGTEAVARLSG